MPASEKANVPEDTDPTAPPREPSHVATPAPATRRTFLGYLGVAGLAVPALTAPACAGEQGSEEAEAAARTEELLEGLEGAEHLIDLPLTDPERQLMAEDLEELQEDYRHLRELTIANHVPPALTFDPARFDPRVPPPAAALPVAAEAPDDPWTSAWRPAGLERPDDEDLPFRPVTDLAALLAAGAVTSEELTGLYLERLATFDPLLHCVVERTADLALRQARRADREREEGRARGPLHGVPWGAKDLLATVVGRTTWGATPYRDQRLGYDAGVVRRMEGAGAVLAAKLTLGALAWGDVWFGGTTRNPWNTEQGSSGSSAGSASAVAAGLVGFALGSETLGSIVSPSTRCGTSGLRPTFGLVGRSGAMALSWSMDKVGPIARSVEDCALVLEALAGPDPDDVATCGRTFRWDPDVDPASLRIGVVQGVFDEDRGGEEAWREHDKATLKTLESLGFDLVDIRLPTQPGPGEDALPADACRLILSVEAAAAFDELTRSGRDDELVRQERHAWPNVFRQARFIPAVEYVEANRVRTLLCQRMAEVMAEVDVYVCPTYGAGNLLLTNLTGHPSVVVPNGFRPDGTPTSITFVGRLFGENELVAVAAAYQRATDFHTRQPPLDPSAAGPDQEST